MIVPTASRLSRLSPTALRTLRRGLEKESLRVAQDGMLSTAPHPLGLGSALTHPAITTDFCEAQPELVTGVHRDIDSLLAELRDLHRFVHAELGDELLWAASMPCKLPADDDIPVAQYGSSNLARIKTVYRYGLGHRYGRHMQTISGIHYNFSLADDAIAELLGLDTLPPPGIDRRIDALKTDQYFGLIRNFRRQVWLLIYLFGASPAVCGTFLAGREHPLQTLAPGTLYLPYATSLRMGSIGYQSDVQSALHVSYNDLEGYAGSLHHALTEPYPAYTAIGIRDGERYHQLSDAILQIENEFYGTIRPKSPVRKGERTLTALARNGVEYVEVRSVDLDPYQPLGVDAAQLRFLDIFLLHCLLSDSPPDSAAEQVRLASNQREVVTRGREPGLLLQRPEGGGITLRDWAMAILDACAPIAEQLDAAHRTSERRESAANAAQNYATALATARARVTDSELTPSAQVLRDVRAQDGSFYRFAMARTREHAATLRALGPLPTLADQRARARQSLAAQARIEAEDDVDFETYRLRYLASVRPQTGSN